MLFIPKPFTFENLILPGLTKVYLPGQSCIEYHVDGFPINYHACVCVHLCEQFFAYPTVEWGIRYIPSDAKCPFGGNCSGARVLVNGKPVNKGIALNYGYVTGLTKPGKTR